MNKEYNKKIIERVIREFIKNNKRAPSITERKELLLQIEKDYVEVDNVGISGYVVETPKFREVISSSKYNRNQKSLFDDLEVILSRLSKIKNDYFNSFLLNKKLLYKLIKEYEQYESRIDNLLLLMGNDDIFYFGIEETFNSTDKIDLEKTTVNCQNGFVQLSSDSYEEIDLIKCKINLSGFSDKGYITYTLSNPLECLKKQTGESITINVESLSMNQKTGYVLDVIFEQPESISSFVFDGLSSSNNGVATIDCFFTLDKTYWTPFSLKKEMKSKNIIHCGKENIYGLRILVSKEKEDYSENDIHTYSFIIENLKILKNNHSTQDRGTLMCGPYYFADSLGNIKNITKATFSACAQVPEDSSINYYLSIDKENWFSVSNENKSIVSFGSHDIDKSIGYLKPLEASNKLYWQNQSIHFETAENDVLILNSFIKPEYIEQVRAENIQVYKNLNSTDQLPNSVGKWLYDNEKDIYTLYVYNELSYNIYINTGDITLKVNGSTVAGNVTIRPGWNKIEIDGVNFFEIEPDISDEESFRKKDKLFPYNLRYLIEGYDYPKSFIGEKVYLGFKSTCQSILKYIPYDQFLTLEEYDGSVFSILENEEGIFFLIKADLNSAYNLNQTADIDFYLQAEESQELWVKAIFETKKKYSTPILESFKIRTI